MDRFSRILFVAEADQDNTAAFRRAVTLAENNQAQLTVLGVVDEPSRSDASLQEAMIEEKREAIQDLLTAAGAKTSSVDTKIASGIGFVEIVRDVLRFERDLIIKPVEQDHDTESHPIGSRDKKLLRKCPCPVWLIRSAEQHGYQEILVALDYDPHDPGVDALNRQLLEMAASLALSEFAELHVVHAWRLEHESALRSPRMGLSTADVDAMLRTEESARSVWLSGLVDECCGAMGEEALRYLKPECHLVQGHARHEVPRLASELTAELVVMGTVGRTGIPGYLIGNTAEAILSQLECSILAVKPAGFVSPITVN